MKDLPSAYAWLADEQGPRMLIEALRLYGTKEYPGASSNPVIMGWRTEVRAKGYSDDGVPWCGLFTAIAAKRAGWAHNPGGNALWARNWALWGNAVPLGEAMLGDVLVYKRGRGGHVALYVGEDDTHYHLLGGNQSDSVNIVRKTRSPNGPNGLLAVRRAPWRQMQPPNVRKVILSPAGAPVSTSEA